MKLTGKCKSDFEKWLSDNSLDVLDLGHDECGFYALPNSMQYGVLVDFFDSKEIYVDSEYYRDDLFAASVTTNYIGLVSVGTEFLRPESRTKAIEKANEIYNEFV